jgi:hypothetical protein
MAYQIYKEIFGSARFKKLADKGARAQRLLWASTGTKNPDYSDVKYVESLIGPDTVNNGVSRLHGKVSRHIFEPLFPHWPQAEVPVRHVTNGVHMPSWDSMAADDLWTEACGKDRWLGTIETLEQDIRRVPDADLWHLRNAASKSFVAYVRQRISLQLAGSGASPEAVENAKQLLDPNALTLGFARRFAAYKRPNLLLHDPDRLLRLLTNPERPVQLVLAGKAHPADQAGQDLIRQWMHFIRRPEARAHVVFLSDYDMLLFAGGIGENAPTVRARICAGLGFLGIEVEEKRNAASEGVISEAARRVTVRVIRTDEEQMIARSVCYALGLGMTIERGKFDHATT